MPASLDDNAQNAALGVPSLGKWRRAASGPGGHSTTARPSPGVDPTLLELSPVQGQRLLSPMLRGGDEP